MSTTGKKKSFISVIDDAMNKADRALDRFRKTPRRRLDVVPEPPNPVDPFGAPALKDDQPVDKPLGDPGLPVQIYGKRTDDVSARTVTFLRERSIVPRMIDLEDPDNAPFETRLIRETKRYEMPWIFVRGQYIGSFSDLAEAAKSGKLDTLLG